MNKWCGNTMMFYLDVPYSRKEEAKQQGCKWAAHKKKWYVQIDPNIVGLLNGGDDNLHDVLTECQRRVPNPFHVVDGYWDGLNESNTDTWNHLLDIMKEM